MVLYISLEKIYVVIQDFKSNQGNQDPNGNQKNVIQGQKPDIGNWNTQQRTHNNQNNTYKATKVNEQLKLH